MYLHNIYIHDTIYAMEKFHKKYMKKSRNECIHAVQAYSAKKLWNYWKPQHDLSTLHCLIPWESDPTGKWGWEEMCGFFSVLLPLRLPSFLWIKYLCDKPEERERNVLYFVFCFHCFLSSSLFPIFRPCHHHMYTYIPTFGNWENVNIFRGKSKTGIIIWNMRVWNYGMPCHGNGSRVARNNPHACL